MDGARQASSQGQPVKPTSAPGAPAQGRGGPPSGQFTGRGGPGGPGYTWWKDEATKKELGLRDEQAKRLDNIYEQRVKDTEPLQQEYDKNQNELDRLMRERLVDTKAIELQFMRVELPRIELDKSRVLTVYRMWKVLDLDQYKKLQAIFERRAAERGRGRGGAPHSR